MIKKTFLTLKKCPVFPKKVWVKLKVTTQTSQMKPEIKPQIPKGTKLSNSINSFNLETGSVIIYFALLKALKLRLN